MAVYHADALVIRSREYGESDRLLTLFARELGKIQAVAKGVRKPKSRQRAAAQLFTYGEYLLHRGRTLDTVNEASPKESFPHLWNDFERTLAASRIAELLDIATIQGQAYPEVFTLTLTVFFLLEHYEPQLLQGAFALRLLHILGYTPRLGECAECGERVSGQRLFMSPAAGGTLCLNCREQYSGKWVAAGSVAFMRQLLYGEIRKLDRLRWNEFMRQEIMEILRTYCEETFESRLRSWQIGDLELDHVGPECDGREGSNERDNGRQPK